MKKLSSIFIALLLGIVALFGIAGCGSANQNESQSKIGELQRKIDQSQSKLNEMQSVIDQSQSKIGELQRKIDQSQSKINELQSKIKELEEVNKEQNSGIGITEAEEEILRNYHEPTIDENFEDNKVNVILKSSYKHLSEIGFEDFKIVDEVSEITSITCYLKTIKRGEGVKLSLRSPIIRLELATHDKEKVLAVIAQLKNLDMVLVAEPSYIYIPTYC